MHDAPKKSLFRSEVYAAVRSIEFDGVDEYLVVGSAASSISFNDTAHTISCWFKVPATSDPLQVLWSFARSTASHSMYMLGVSASGSLWIYGRGDTGGVYPVASGGSPAVVGSGYDDGAWHHVAVTYDGSTGMNVYVDGGSATAIAVSAGSITPDSMSVGARRAAGATSYPLEGSIADISVFSRVLDAGELVVLSTAPILDYGAMSPVFWSWMGDKDALTDMRDHGLNNGTLTLTNGVAGDLKDGAPS